MTLARKRSRLIVVDGERYRWKFTEDRRYFRWIGFTVLPAEGKGQMLDAFSGENDGSVITPGLVAEVIRHALARGWTPRQRGEGMGLSFAHGTLTGPREYNAARREWVSRFEPVRLSSWHAIDEYYPPPRSYLQSLLSSARMRPRSVAVVDGTQYLWGVAGKEGWPLVGLTVERADAAGQRMAAWADVSGRSDWTTDLITPDVVADVIRLALTGGWAPMRPRRRTRRRGETWFNVGGGVFGGPPTGDESDIWLGPYHRTALADRGSSAPAGTL